LISSSGGLRSTGRRLRSTGPKNRLNSVSLSFGKVGANVGEESLDVLVVTLEVNTWEVAILLNGAIGEASAVAGAVALEGNN